MPAKTQCKCSKCPRNEACKERLDKIMRVNLLVTMYTEEQLTDALAGVQSDFMEQLAEKDGVIVAMAGDVLKGLPSIFCPCNPYDQNTPCPSNRSFPEDDPECLECYVKRMTAEAKEG